MLKDHIITLIAYEQLNHITIPNMELNPEPKKLSLFGCVLLASVPSGTSYNH